MAGKLTIRRVGNFLPTLCLLGILLAVGIVTWLCTAGLPGCALRYIEEEAAKADIQLHIDKIRLSPRSGLAFKAEDIEITLPQPDVPPAVFNVRKAQVALSIGRMLTGQFRPANIRVVDGYLVLPLSNGEEDKLELKELDVYTVFHNNGHSVNTQATAEFCNIDVELNLRLANPETALDSLSTGQEYEEDSGSPAEQLAALRPTLQRIRYHLQKQPWNEHNRPHVELSLAQRKEWKAQLNAQIPAFDFEHFHFREANLNATIADNVFTVNNLQFQTVNPDTKVSLQGGYDWVDRELEFNTKSTAPLVQMLNRYLGQNSPEILNKIQSEADKTPQIELSGSASFAPDYALNKIALRGKIEQHKMNLGRVPVDYVHLSFFMRDGQFNVDNFKLELPDGHITASAHATGKSGYAELDLSLPDETILALTHELGGDKAAISLPEGLSFDSNLALRAKVNLLLSEFIPGKSRAQDLIPVLQSGDIQFNCGDITYNKLTLYNPAFTLHVDGIDYSSDHYSAANISLDTLVGKAEETEELTNAANLLLNLHLKNLKIDKKLESVFLHEANVRASGDSVHYAETGLHKLHASAELTDLSLNVQQLTETLHSDAISAKIQAASISYNHTEAKELFLDLAIPQGINLADAWNNMQKNASLTVSAKEIYQNGNFKATTPRLDVRNVANDKAELVFTGKLGEESATINATASLEGDNILKLDNAQLRLPLAQLKPLFGEEPLAELKLPQLIEGQANATINTANGQILNSQYQLRIPRLVRVCNNVHVHKGREIPLELEIGGNFNTSEDGTMHYEADILARHELGELKVHAGGNPLTECHITGSNTIPVSVINALIDDVDAHWIMRDFRCTPGVTQNNITHIDTTIRYDQGIYVYVTCKAELTNMDFLLGAIRDKEDADGNPTGEEYLRTDLGKDPYSTVKHGTCDVEVLVQLDCKDNAGNPLPEQIRINLLNPDLLYDNRPWLKRMGWKKGAATSRITGEAVRFNIDNSTISLHKLKGSCYPAYSIGMYYAPIQHFLSDVELKEPADIATDYCIFPLSRNCDVPMKGLIKANAAKGAGFRFLGTTIPFTNFSGFINISDVDVYLDRMNAECWGGMLDGSLRIGFAGEHTTLDGFFVARNLNLKDIVASYGETFTPATCNGYIRFQAAEPELDAVRAYGQVHLKDGNLMQMGLFRPVGAFLSDVPGNLTKLQESVHLKQEEAPPSWADKLIRTIFDTGSNALDTVQRSAYNVPFANHFLRYGIDEAFTRFDITQGHLITRGMKAKGYNLNVGVDLNIDLEKLTLTGDLWPKISSVPTLIISPITILSDFLIDINVYGDLLSPQWEFGLSKKLKGDAASVTSEPQKEESLQAE